MMSSEKQKCTTENVHSEEDEKCEPSGKFSVSLKAGSKRSGGKIEDKKSVFINIGKKKSDLHTEALASKKLTVPKPNNENAIHDFKGKAAAVFNNESDSEEEEMPLECRMKMRNMGRDTITSAGPNSFNKGKEGFSHNSFKKFELSMKPRNNKETKHDCKQRNIAVRCKQREVEQSGLKKFERDVQVSFPFVKAIGLEKELEGHSGCVNCLEWSSCGDYLVSGSDDTQIILWDIRKRKASVKISTSHEGNIFSVKFLPYSSNNIIASSAADRVVNLYDVFTQSEIHSFKCHSGRVKKLAVSNHLPFLLWSGSEDGSVREFDLREPYHECSSSCSNIFINLRQHVMLTSEVKCIQVHPTQPELIAVGCNDAYLRLFDRRMVKQNRATNSTLFDNCVDYFAPGHLLPRSSKVSKRRLFVTTHLAFSPNGAEILQNLGGDHIYSYNLLEKNLSFKFKAPCDKNCATSNELQHNYKASANNMLSSTYATRQSLPNVVNSDSSHDKAMNFKVKGNEAFSKKNYYQAVVYYNEALTIFPSSSVLLANRAAALLQRKWNGDLYSSLRDSQAAVTLDPLHHKAFLRQVKCLQELRMHEDALKCFELFKEKFPEQAESATAKQLEADIRKSIITKNADSDNDHSVYLPEYKLNNKEELSRREKSYDYSTRFVGTCNITTDIKEASYFGSYGQYIVAGSDCGCMFIWERATANILKALHGDESIVNCLQPHPTACLIATSGIDPVVRLWSPQYDSKKLALNTQNLVCSNQKNMNSDPLDEMLRTMGYIPTLSDGDESDEPRVNCATS